MSDPIPIDEELYKRILLTHRFGLENIETTYKGVLYSTEELPFDKAITELKQSFSEFMSSRDHLDKLFNQLRSALTPKLKKFSIKESNIIIHTIHSSLSNFYTPDYFNHLSEDLAQDKIIIVPLKTTAVYPNGISYSIKGIVLFEDRLIKINGQGSLNLPGLRVYRTKSYDHNNMLSILQTYLGSFKEPLEISSWDHSINVLTEAEKIRHITKKEQSVGNGSWLTSKLLVLATVFATLFKFCKSEGLKDLEIDPIALNVAEFWYKLFIVDDRNRAIREYLNTHHFNKIPEPLTVSGRLESIKTFLEFTPKSAPTPDKHILSEIYLKSLNWLLADYLKKGDIGAAHALIEEERENQRWNPLFYAAKMGKHAIAELLASSTDYVNGRNSDDNTPLHYAALHGHMIICKIFLRYKNKNHINLLAQNARGNTATHLAIRYNKLDIADILIKAEPQLLSLQNNKNQTLLKLACDLQNREAVARLLLKGAKPIGLTLSEYPEDIQKILKNPPKLAGGPSNSL